MRTLSRTKNRQGRCFELAAKVMIRELGSESFTLVHGLIRGWIAHAWIELEGGSTVYDAVQNRYFSASEYAENEIAVTERRYDKDEAMRLIATTRHPGPWHKTEGGFR